MVVVRRQKCPACILNSVAKNSKRHSDMGASASVSSKPVDLNKKSRAGSGNRRRSWVWGEGDDVVRVLQLCAAIVLHYLTDGEAFAAGILHYRHLN